MVAKGDTNVEAGSPGEVVTPIVELAVTSNVQNMISTGQAQTCINGVVVQNGLTTQQVNIGTLIYNYSSYTTSMRSRDKDHETIPNFHCKFLFLFLQVHNFRR